MGQKYLDLSEKLIDFVQQQQMFVGTAEVDGKLMHIIVKNIS